MPVHTDTIEPRASAAPAAPACPVLRAPAIARALVFAALLCAWPSLCARVASAQDACVQQQLRFDRFSVEDGLSNNHVRHVFQDRAGFFWISTGDGLNRYDGYEFKSYRHDPDDPTSIAGNIVNDVAEASDGLLWIATARGLSRFDPRTQKASSQVFYRDAAQRVLGTGSSNGSPTERAAAAGGLSNGATNGSSNGASSGSSNGASSRSANQSATAPANRLPAGVDSTDVLPVRAVEVDSTGRVWIATRGGGLGVLEPGDAATDAEALSFFRRIPGDDRSLPSDSVSGILVDSRGSLWVTTSGRGLSRFHPDTGDFTNYRRDPRDPESLASDYIRALREDTPGALILGMWRGGVDRMDLDTPGVFEHLVGWSREGPARDRVSAQAYVSSGELLYALVDRSGTAWVSTYHPTLERVTFAAAGADTRPQVRVIAHNPSDPYSLADNGIGWMHEDRSGALWFGGVQGGLSRLDPRDAAFCHIRHDPGNPASIPENNVTAVVTSDDGLWVGTSSGGLARYDRERGAFVRYRHDPDDRTSLQDDRVLALHRDDRGVVWVSTRAGGISRYNPTTDSFRRFAPRTNWGTLASGAGEAFSSSRNSFWVATAGGPGRWYPAEARFEDLSIDFGRQRFATALVEDRAGALWVAFDDGRVALRDGNTGAVHEFGDTTHPESARTLAAARTQALFEDSRGRMWAGTADGLFLLNDPSGNLVRFSVDDGLPNRVVNSIAEDDNGRLWLGTHGGLSRFDVDTKTFLSFGISDGLQGRGFGRAAHRDSNGRLYFGGRNGLNAFHPDSVATDAVPMNLVFTSLVIPSDPDASAAGTAGVAPSHQTTIDLTALNRVEVPFRDRFVTLGVAALGPVPADGIRYAYRLRDKDARWIDLGARNLIALAGLSPGLYNVEVRATSASGRWLPANAVLEITVHPPWWRSQWAIVLYLAAGLIVLYAGLRYERNRALLKERLRHEHATTQKLRELDQAKSHFLANLSHEFRTPLTLIVGPLQQLQAEGGDKRYGIILRNARRLQRLINQILQLSRLEAGHVEMNASVGDLVAFTRSVVLAMTPLAERESVELNTSGNTSGNTSDEQPVYVAFDPEHMERIVGNLLSNALKFTPAGGRVTVLVRADGGRGIIEVSDTGIGIPPGQLAHVFDRFYQVDATATRRYEGTGIGLALVKELAEAHGGGVSAESAVGRGSTFTVWFPAVDSPAELVDAGSGNGTASEAASGATAEDAADVAADVAANVAANVVADGVAKDGATIAADINGAAAEGAVIDDAWGGGRTRVLVVDDNADLRAYTRSLLEGTYDVLEARDGIEGLEAARTNLPDVIIADVMMPRLDGFELSRAVKSDAELGGVPVILLTALADPGDEATGFGAGADQFVTKPFDADVLLARVASVLAQRARLKELYAEERGGDGQHEDQGQPGQPPEFASELGQQVVAAIEAHLDDSAFSVERLADAMAMSASQLRRRMKDELGITPSALLQRQRLVRAARFLKEGAGNVSEVAFACGYSSIHYFSRAYRAHHGVPPSQHLRRTAGA